MKKQEEGRAKRPEDYERYGKGWSEEEEESILEEVYTFKGKYKDLVEQIHDRLPHRSRSSIRTRLLNHGISSTPRGGFWTWSRWKENLKKYNCPKKCETEDKEGQEEETDIPRFVRKRDGVKNLGVVFKGPENEVTALHKHINHIAKEYSSKVVYVKEDYNKIFIEQEDE